MAKRRAATNGQATPVIKHDRAAAASQALSKLRSLGLEVKPKNWEGDGQIPVPQIITFSGYATQLGRVYRNPDEAWRDSRENARYMRNDLSIMECVDARQLAVALMPLQIDADGDSSSTAKELVTTMTQILMKVPRLTEYRRSLQDAIWYGRCGIQHNYGKVKCRGRMVTCLRADGRNPAWLPISGDKLAFPYDRQGVGIRIGFAMPVDGLQWGGAKAANDLDEDMFWDGERVRKVEMTSEYGRVYWLDEDELDRVNIHKHFIEDAPFETPLQAGRIHGVGVRDRVYWTWFIKQNTAALLTEYLERSAFGFEVWTYPMGNNEALLAIEEAAKTRSGFGKNIVFVPVIPGQEGLMDFQHQEIGAQGMELFNTLVHEYYEWQIKRYILGQIQSSEPVGGGLGTSGLADLQGKSLQNILLYDAANAEESLTIGLLEPLRRKNRHVLPINSDSIELRVRINTRSDEADKLMEAIEKCHTMGLPIKTDSLYQVAGIEKPLESDTVLLGGPIPKSLSERAESEQAAPQPGQPGAPMGPGPGGPPPAPEAATGKPNPGGDMPHDADHDGMVNDGRADERPDAYSRYSEPDGTWDIYRPVKDQIEWNGLRIGIENRAGTRRRPDWKPLAHDYGYLYYTAGADRDPVDCFVGPDLQSPYVYVVDQEKPNGTFDEHKCMLGFPSLQAARDGYVANYDAGWHVGPISQLTVEQFRNWLDRGDTTDRLRPVQYLLAGSDLLRVPEKYKNTTGWVTMGAHGGEGGTPVYLENGRITKGPKGLAGQKVDKIKKPRDRISELEDVDPISAAPESKTKIDPKTGKEIKKRKNREVVNYDAMYAANTKEAAERHGLDKHDLREAVNEIWRHEKDQLDAREATKVDVRRQTGLTGGQIEKMVNAGQDFSKIKGFDNMAISIAHEYPELGLGDGDSQEAQERLWDFVSEGRILPTPKHDPSLIDRAARDLLRRQEADQRWEDREPELVGNIHGSPDYDPDLDFARRGERTRYRRDPGRD